MIKILITGGNGYIAKNLYSAFSKQHQITVITRNDFDLSDNIQVCSWFNYNQYDVVIHTAISGGSRLQNDDQIVYDKNLEMLNNLIKNKHCFSKLISFGSGAEIYHGNTPYANSKRKIAEIVNTIENWYNLRIFGAFDHNELPTRFIKGNILRYLKKEPMILHSNKIMDFYYINDLINIVDHYIQNDDLPKTINCSYDEKYTLTHLANFINTLDNHKVPVIIESNSDLQFYCGNPHNLPIKEVGIKQGIINTFNHLKDLNNDSGNCE